MVDQELERLRGELRSLRTENKLVGAGFLIAFCTTETLLPAALESSHLATVTLPQLTTLCFVLGGALMATLLTGIYRLHGYLHMRQSESNRMQQQLLHLHGKGAAR